MTQPRLTVVMIGTTATVSLTKPQQKVLAKAKDLLETLAMLPFESQTAAKETAHSLGLIAESLADSEGGE